LIYNYLYGSFANGGRALSDENMSFAPPGAPEDNSELGQARRLFDQGLLEQCRTKVAKYWLENTYDQEAVRLFAELVRELGREEIAVKLDNFAKKLDAIAPYKNHQEIFEAGYALVEICQHELAAMLLKELHRELPDDPLVNYELGFSLMSLKRFKEARKYFAQAANLKDDFDALLNLCVCETLERNCEGARRLITEMSSLANSDEEKTELVHRKLVLARLESLDGKKQLNNRDWLYALYGTILLRPDIKPQELKDDITQIASMLVILRGLLAGLSIETEAVEYYSLRSRPITNALSQLMEVTYDAYRGPHRPDQVMLLMCWTTDILGPHGAFIENSLKRSLFAYSLSPVEPLPLVPDIIGCLAHDIVMPWEGADQSNKDVSAITEQIYARACDLESDPSLLRETQEAVEYYVGKRRLLVLGNAEAFPNRPEYTAELPNLEQP